MDDKKVEVNVVHTVKMTELDSVGSLWIGMNGILGDQVVVTPDCKLYEFKYDSKDAARLFAEQNEGIHFVCGKKIGNGFYAGFQHDINNREIPLADLVQAIEWVLPKMSAKNEKGEDDFTYNHLMDGGLDALKADADYIKTLSYYVEKKDEVYKNILTGYVTVPESEVSKVKRNYMVNAFLNFGAFLYTGGLTGKKVESRIYARGYHGHEFSETQISGLMAITAEEKDVHCKYDKDAGQIVLDIQGPGGWYDRNNDYHEIMREGLPVLDPLELMIGRLVKYSDAMVAAIDELDSIAQAQKKSEITGVENMVRKYYDGTVKAD